MLENCSILPLSPLKFVHHITGVPCLNTKMIFLLGQVFCSATNYDLFRPSTFYQKNHVSSLAWPRDWLYLLARPEQTVSEACTLTFFTAARMGRLLYSQITTFTFDLSFLSHQWHSPIGLMPFQRVQNTLDFQGLTPSHPLALVTDAACLKSVTHGPYKS
jgi:hypothetical protein